MAVIALGHGRQVIQILTPRCDIVMTTGASAEYLKVIDHHGRFPHAGRVAVFTDVGAVDVLKRLAGGGYTVMATRTTSQYLQVIHLQGGFPHAGRVAVLTDIGAVDVLERLAGGSDTVMA
jgi:hypothetical protein